MVHETSRLSRGVWSRKMWPLSFPQWPFAFKACVERRFFSICFILYFLELSACIGFLNQTVKTSDYAKIQRKAIQVPWNSCFRVYAFELIIRLREIESKFQEFITKN